MNIKKSFIILLILFTVSQICLGQEVDFDRNWSKDTKGIDDWHSRYDYRNYTKEDVEKAINRFQLIQANSANNDEWEGIYGSGVELGMSEFQWNSTGGFVKFYIYHTLGSLDFGRVINTPDSVTLISEKAITSKPKSIFITNLIKVKYGDNHYLVPETRLKDFAERAVGLSVSLGDWGYYLYKSNGVDNELYGLPVLPKKYRHLLRSPINTKITKIGKHIIHQKKRDDGTVTSEDIYRFVTLGAGKDKRVKVGMNFYVDDLNEWIEITEVSQNRSIGKIQRDFDGDGNENCREIEGGSGIGTPCKDIKIGMKARTKVSETFF